jgi:NADPH:quinone reductase-like Zn-dependent oxidoreductase
MAHALNRAVDTNAIKPVVDRVFALDDVREAYAYQASGALFGKVVIKL